jgi:hypothetical protein
MRHNPYLYEINARLFLKRLSGKYGQRLTLAGIPEEEWSGLERRGFDLVWLMGVWQRSPGSRQKARLAPSLHQEYEKALPGWSDEDIDGSPYAVREYRLDASLGKPSELAGLRAELNRHGLGLVLDFVPNHLALDHPWVSAHPERFVRGGEVDVRAHPDWFFTPKEGLYLAHGRDPNFLPWTDTAQLNFFSPDLRKALIKELLRIAGAADGVRCDMAMLVLNDVFGDVWGGVAGDSKPETEFWAEAIGAVKQVRPDFLFLAEVYWGREKKLQELGFDFTYNKRLYDALRSADLGTIRRLLADTVSLQHSANFIENHDEPRAPTAFGRERSLAAAVIIATIPGLRFFHDGQFAGRCVRLPVQMVREPNEEPDAAIMSFYERLMSVVNRPVFHDGEWQLLELAPAWEGNESFSNLLAWCWRSAGETAVVIVNYSPDPAQGRLRVPLPEAKTGVLFHDELTGTTYERDPDEVRGPGLYIAMEPYQSHLFNMKAG